jgi:hypothetical protein
MAAAGLVVPAVKEVVAYLDGDPAVQVCRGTSRGDLSPPRIAGSGLVHLYPFRSDSCTGESVRWGVSRAHIDQRECRDSLRESPAKIGGKP